MTGALNRYIELKLANVTNSGNILEIYLFLFLFYYTSNE